MTVALICFVGYVSLPPGRGYNGSASSLDLRAGRGVGADNIIILGSLHRDCFSFFYHFQASMYRFTLDVRVFVKQHKLIDLVQYIALVESIFLFLLYNS